MDLWLRRFDQRPDAENVVVCFPHAGGSAGYYRPLSAALPASVELHAVQYPGRQDRLAEPLIGDVATLAERATPTVLELADRPLALFGHSMGASVAFEVACLLERRDVTPLGLFASARRAPSRRHARYGRPIGDEELIADIVSMGGTGSELLHDPGLADLMLPALRNDLHAARAYHRAEDVVVGCPVLALLGDADPKVEIDDARAWARHTTGGFSLRTFPGGHFYTDDHTAALADVVVTHLAKARA